MTAWAVRGRIGDGPFTVASFEHGRLRILGPHTPLGARVSATVGVEFDVTGEGPRVVGSDTDPVAAYWTVLRCYDEVDDVSGDAPEWPVGGVLGPDDDNPDDDGEETLMEWEPGLHPRAYARGWDESKRRRWPKGTPGGLGGKFRDKASAAKLSKITGVPAAELLRDPSKAIPGRAARKPTPARARARVPARKPVPLPTTEGAIDCGGDVRKAARLLAEGKAVQLRQPREVSILLDELAAIVADAKQKGEAAPDYDLCKVVVKGQSLFCVESKGIPRNEMPQLKGVPEEGSAAWKMKKTDDPYEEVDLTPDFVKFLESKGFKTEDGEEHVAYLRPSQNELNGKKVAGMVQWMRGGGNPNPSRKGGPGRELGMIVSEDNYIVDGHHRWAATIGLDAEDNRLGNDKAIPITRIRGLDAVSLLSYAVAFTSERGIQPAGFGQTNPKNA